MVRRKRKRNELARDIAGFGVTGIGLTVGSKVVSSIGGSASAGVGSGIVRGASFMPGIASLIAGKHIIRQVQKLSPKRKGRR